MLIIGGSIGAGRVAAGCHYLSGHDVQRRRVRRQILRWRAPRHPWQQCRSQRAPAPMAPAPAATATPAGGDEFSSLLDAPESAKPAATTPGQPPSDPAANTNQQAPPNNQSGQPNAPQQPTAPVVVAIAPPPPVNPVNPVQPPRPPVNNPAAAKSAAGRQHAAGRHSRRLIASGVSRDQLKLLRQYYISLLSGDEAVLIEKMRWSPRVEAAHDRRTLGRIAADSANAEERPPATTRRRRQRTGHHSSRRLGWQGDHGRLERPRDAWRLLGLRHERWRSVPAAHGAARRGPRGSHVRSPGTGRRTW